MSLKKEKEMALNNTQNNNEDILVYEPIRRNSAPNEENESNGKAKLTRKFTGLYNRGSQKTNFFFI